MSVYVAIKPKYPTRKAYDKVIFDEGNMLTIIEVSTPRQLIALMDTSHVALIHENKYYPIDENNCYSEFDAVNNGSTPTVEEDAKFGIKKLQTFVSNPTEDITVASQIQSEFDATNSIFRGTLLKVTKPINKTINKKGYWFVFNFDLTSATSEGYSNIAMYIGNIKQEIVEGANYVFAGVDEVSVYSNWFTINADLTVEGNPDTIIVAEAFDNRMNVKISIASDDVDPIYVNGVPCDTMKEALDKINLTGGTIKISKSFTENFGTIDLTGGKDYAIILENNAYANIGRINVKSGTMLVDGTGTLNTDIEMTAPLVAFNEDPTKSVSVTVTKNVTLSGFAGFFMSKNSVNTDAIISGTLIGRGTADYGGMALYINGTAAENCNLTFTGTAKTDKEYDITAVYLAGKSNTLIKGATIIGTCTGIEVRAGNVVIEDSTVISTYSGEVTVAANGNGSTTSGPALAVAQHTTAQPVNVTVKNSTLSGESCCFMESNPQQNPTATEDTTIILDPIACVGEIRTNNPDTDCKNFIYGGKYNIRPDDKYIAEGYIVKETFNNRFEVVKA